MKLDEVPQDKSNYRGKDEAKKIVYATGADGQYTSAVSQGWEAEHTATRDAWAAIEEDLAETEAAVRAGELSPVPYFMKKCLMDIGILAAHMGRWKLTIRRHFKPAVFQKLSEKTLQQYAAVFNISAEELRSFGK